MSYGSYTCITELILVFHILYVYYGSYTYLTDYITFYWYKSTRRYYRAGSLYRGTRRYHWTYTYSCTKVPVGTTYITGLILTLQDLYLFGSPIGVTELSLMQNLCYNKLRFTRVSHRSYRAYSYSEIPVGIHIRTIHFRFLLFNI